MKNIKLLPAFFAAVSGLAVAAATAGSATAAETQVELEEIVVTAQKRAEGLQETPISVAAFSADALDRGLFVDVSDVGRMTPNVSFSSGEGGGKSTSNIFIRGIGQLDFLISSDPGVGIYLDGVYLARTVGSLLDTLDFERIEVLRGPQGTLYGKNTMGGAINLVSRLPNGDFGGSIELTAGRFHRMDVKGSVQFPLGDAVSVRMSGMLRDRDGYGRRLLDGEEMGNDNVSAGRVVVRYQPSDDLDIVLSGDLTHRREAGLVMTMSGANSDATLVRLFNQLVAGPVYGTQFDNRWKTDSPFTTNGTGPNFNNLDTWGLSATAEWQVSDAITFKSLSAYRDMENSFTRDGDNSPLPMVEGVRGVDQYQVSQEFQLTGDSLEGRLKWIAGAYYFREKASSYLEATAFGGLWEAMEALPGPLPGLPFGGAGNLANLDVSFRIDDRLKTDSYAAFGQLTYALGDQVNVTTGLRYTHDKKIYSIEQYRPASGRIVIPLTTRRDSWNNLSPKLTIDYTPAEDLMVYASISRGFRSGGFNGRGGTSGGVLPYDPEKMTAYEVGLKSQWLENRLRFNAAAFYYDYSDILLTSSTADAQGNQVVITDNVGKARVQGFEAELTAVPFRNFEIVAGAGFTDAKFTDVAATAREVTEDSRFVAVPKWMLNLTARYTVPMESGAALSAEASVNYKSRLYQDVLNSPELVQDGYALVNARLAWDSADENWTLALFATNLTNKKYINRGSSFLASLGTSEAYYGRPREWGVSVKARF